MASPPFEVEDHTDGDFFDKLVNEKSDDDVGGSSIENAGSGEAKRFSNLIIDEFHTAEVDSDGKVVSEFLDSQGDDLTAEESVSVTPDDNVVKVIQSNDVPLEAKGELDSEKGNIYVTSGKGVKEVDCSLFNSTSQIQSNDVALEAKAKLDSEKGNLYVTSGKGVKEVDWSLFNSTSQISNGCGTGSFSDFFSELGSGDLYGKEEVDYGISSNNAVFVPEDDSDGFSPVTSVQHEVGQYHGSQMEQAIEGYNLNSDKNLENLYPGWRYDPNTGQWHQLEGDNSDTNFGSAAHSVVTEQRSDPSYFQQTDYSVFETLPECTKANVTIWNDDSQQNVAYPVHMIFDPQYPGWYYDTIAQEWRLLESYTETMNHPTGVDHNQKSQDMVVSKGGFLPEENHCIQYNIVQIGNCESQGLSSQNQVSTNYYSPQIRNTWQTARFPHSGVVDISDNRESHNPYVSAYHANNSSDQQNQQMRFTPSETSTLPEQASQRFCSTNSISGSQTFIPAVNFSPHTNQHKQEPSRQMHFSPAYFESQQSPNFSQPLQSGTQFPYASGEGRSSAGRPPHALMTFGFGGKLLVMKYSISFTNSANRGQESTGSFISILNLMDAVMAKTDASSVGFGACDYFYTWCQHSFPGPLVGGNVGSREVNKWIDEKISNCESPDMNCRKGELLRLIFSLLKIACQHYGKLRSPFGTDKALKESDCPESAVAKLFASAKRNVGEYDAFSCCLWNLPSAGEIQATAFNVQKLLVSGRIKEALQCAQEGQLWGPALVLAAQLGDQFYGDTVKQMALRQLVVGSPLGTLCLLIAGKPADVFCNPTRSSSLPGAENISQHSSEVICWIEIAAEKD
ncbi:hypothetical protein U1Q18_023348 [Sarracenia purpurea var. burkii]